MKIYFDVCGDAHRKGKIAEGVLATIATEETRTCSLLSKVSPIEMQSNLNTTTTFGTSK